MDDLHRALARDLTKQRAAARTARRDRIAALQDRSRMLDEICSAAGVHRTLRGFGWRECVNEITAAILKQRSDLAAARVQIDALAAPIVSTEGETLP